MEDLKLVSPQGSSPVTAISERTAEVLVRMEAMQKDIQGLKDENQGLKDENQGLNAKVLASEVSMEAMQKEIQASEVSMEAM